LSSVQQACLASDLVKGLCFLFLVLLVSSFFLILTFDKKKKRAIQVAKCLLKLGSMIGKPIHYDIPIATMSRLSMLGYW